MLSRVKITKALIRLHRMAGWSASLLFASNKIRFSYSQVHMYFSCLVDEDESRLTGPNAPQIIKCCPTKQMAVTSIDSPLKDMVESLLNALVVKYNGKPEDGMYTFF